MADQFIGHPCNLLDVWQTPTGYPPLDLNNNKTGCPKEDVKFCRGIRKNLSGRWKRITTHKKPEEVYTIPEHLRYQLKSLYVY